MNTLKRTLALVASLAMAATAFASCSNEKDSASTVQETTTKATDAPVETTTEVIDEEGKLADDVKTGGDTFTIAAWNHDDVPYLIAQWKGLDFKTVVEDLADNKVEGINFIDMNVGGGGAAEKYDQLFNDGADLDVYFCEADWALKYINDDERTLPLTKLGLSDKSFPNIYSYTDEIGKDAKGVRKGISWQAAAGGFAYRADLAEQYLGVTSPEEMDAKIGNWADFVAAAKSVSEQTSGGVALADTLGGLWQAFACGRTQPWVVDNQLVIDDFCKDFADTAKELWECGGVTKNSQWTDEWTAAGTTGNCMGYFVSTWGFGGFFLTAAGGVDGAQYGKWAVCQGPTPFYWGGTWIVVNPATDNGEEARDFILSATSDEKQMAEYAKAKPEYVNNSKVMDELISGDTVFNPEISGNFKDGQNYFKMLAENAAGIDFKGLITEYDSTIKGNFADAVKENYLDGGKSWDETVEAFKDKVAESCPDLDWED